MTTSSRVLRLAPAIAGAGVVAAVNRLVAAQPRLDAPLERTNFHGRTVSLRGGVAVAAGATAVGLASAVVAPGDLPGRRAAGAAGLATAAAGAAGLVDDLDQGAHDGQTPTKGLAGHLGALAEGRVTTGALKIAVIGSGAALAGGVMAASAASHGHRLRAVGDAVVRAVAIASWANVHNLLDLRPGRALKVAGLLATPVALTPASSGPVPAALARGALACVAAGAADDLAERTMLGDTGANAVGALVGATLAAHPSRWLRAAGALTGTALVLASEKVSFSRVIARTPVLSALDALGRREA
ncbi:hypothetical protein [Actinomyces faecalis]|uniref:hypothetical protein n=1 Tax=Actinomyces faecalis TaxID=2722820 RepID=UPI001C13182E|nr:hypothetical protein [Actinomyces faecalis]